MIANCIANKLARARIQVATFEHFSIPLKSRRQQFSTISIADGHKDYRRSCGSKAEEENVFHFMCQKEEVLDLFFPPKSLKEVSDKKIVVILGEVVVWHHNGSKFFLMGTPLNPTQPILA